MHAAETAVRQKDADEQGRARSGHFVSKDGTRIAFDRMGHGPPVILVVGALCSRTMGPSVKLAPLLARQLTVFSYDRRGRGESADGSPYSVEREIEDLAALIEEAGGSASVFGHSSGAVLALDAAARGLSIRKLALYEPPFVVDDSRPAIEREWAQIESFLAEDRRADAVRVFLRSVGVPAFAVALMRWLPVWGKILAASHTLPYDGKIVGPYQRGTPLSKDTWAKVTAPALVIAGGKSPLWMQNGARALVSVLRGGELRVLAGQTHDPSAKILAPVLEEHFGGGGTPGR